MLTRRPWTPVPAASALLLVVPVVLLSGCGDVERREAAAAADRFTAAVSGDPGAACELLAPRTAEALEKDGSPCSTALADEDLPQAGSLASVAVAGHTAQVRYTGETLFLSLFDDGWKVTAAGCTRTSDDPAVPYDCLVEGN